MLHFQYLEYFIALAAVPLMILLYLLLVKWKKSTSKKIGDPELVKELTASYAPGKFRIKFILFLVAFALCVLAVAGLVIPDPSQRITRRGTDIMIALDVSKSMLANDISPSRLERAKQLISKIIDRSPDDRIGMVIFAGRAYLQMPVTIDHQAAKMYLSSASPDDVPTQGTVISDALRMCDAAFNPKDKTFKSILLISDGEDHDDAALSVAKDLAKQGIMINTVGIGSPQGAPIMDPSTGQYKTDEKGQTVISKLNSKELEEIARATKGTFQLYSNTDLVAEAITGQLANIGKETTASDSSFAAFKQFFQYFLAAALLLLLAEFFTPEKKRTYAKQAMAVMALLLFAGTGFSQTPRQSVIKGNKAYQEKKYDVAENEYRDALKINDHDAAASYNLGNVLYRKDQTDEAIQLYDNAIKDAPDNTTRQKAYYNKGVAFQKAGKLPECITAYKNALLLDPQDEEARQNLQRALKQQQQQQQNQDKKQKDKDQQQKPQKQDEKQQNKPQQQQQPPPSKISKQDAEEKLKSLMQNEKQLQDKLHKVKGAPAPNSPDKDW